MSSSFLRSSLSNSIRDQPFSGSAATSERHLPFRKLESHESDTLADQERTFNEVSIFRQEPEDLSLGHTRQFFAKLERLSPSLTS
jgi:hypothetical protein